MSIECGECERDLRGGHDVSCSRHPDNKSKSMEKTITGAKKEFDSFIEAGSKVIPDLKGISSCSGDYDVEELKKKIAEGLDQPYNVLSDGVREAAEFNTALENLRQVDLHKRHAYNAAGSFLDGVNVRRLQEELGDYLYRMDNRAKQETDRLTSQLQEHMKLCSILRAENLRLGELVHNAKGTPNE